MLLRFFCLLGKGYKKRDVFELPVWWCWLSTALAILPKISPHFRFNCSTAKLQYHCNIEVILQLYFVWSVFDIYIWYITVSHCKWVDLVCAIHCIMWDTDEIYLVFSNTTFTISYSFFSDTNSPQSIQRTLTFFKLFGVYMFQLLSSMMVNMWPGLWRWKTWRWRWR